MSEKITVAAPAKLNLALSVGGRDERGMHPIASWMVTIDLEDQLTLMRLEEDRMSRYAILWHDEARRSSEINWPVHADLAVRAHLALEHRLGRKLPVQLKLEKRIPVGGGLGGGSSDAAATLRALNALFDLGLSEDELAEVGAALGSDVPFFIRGGSAIVEGLGERIEPQATLPELHAVLILPGVPCPTGEVYDAFDRVESQGLDAARVRALASRDGPIAPGSLFNDLTPAAERVAPEVSQLLADASKIAERPACLSGSGSTVFVLCDDPIHAEALAKAFEDRLDLPAIPVQTKPLVDETTDAHG